MAVNAMTYKMIPVHTADNYKLQDVFPYVRETGVSTVSDLLEYILSTWFNGTEAYPGLENWLPSMSLPAKAWAEPGLLSVDDRERIRVRIHFEDGRKGFLAAIQSGTWNPVFFVRPYEGNPYMTNFLLKLGMEMGGVC